MELPNIKETAPSASGYPIKDYALKPHEMSSSEYHTRHISKMAIPYFNCGVCKKGYTNKPF